MALSRLAFPLIQRCKLRPGGTDQSCMAAGIVAPVSLPGPSTLGAKCSAKQSQEAQMCLAAGHVEIASQQRQQSRQIASPVVAPDPKPIPFMSNGQ